MISPQEDTLFLGKVKVNQSPSITNQEWIQQQSQDKTIGKIRDLLQSKKLSQCKGHTDDSIEMKAMLRHKQQFILRNGLLYRKVQFCSHDQPSLQFVLPQDYRQQAMKASHDDIGHLGLERSSDLLKDRFHWAGMSTDIENHMQTCDRCLCFKSKPQETELYPITTTHLLELVHMDSLTVDLGKTSKDVNNLVFTDYFIHYAQAFVTPSQTA